MPEALLRTWGDRDVALVQGYGLTEAAPNVLCVPPEDAQRKLGYAGKIWCTHATKDLAEILLHDSAHIQAKDAEFYNKRSRRRQSPDRIEPLYVLEDVLATIEGGSRKTETTETGGGNGHVDTRGNDPRITAAAAAPIGLEHRRPGASVARREMSFRRVSALWPGHMRSAS